MYTFEIFVNGAGEYQFRLVAGNGQTVAMGEGYSSRQQAQEGVARIQKNAATAQVVMLPSSRDL